MMRKAYLVLYASLICWGCTPVQGASPASVSGFVRDSAGVGQAGAVVQLLRPDLSVLAIAYTGSNGRFTFSGVLPGRYAIKALGESFLPSLREDIRVRSSMVVNLTLNTLYEAMQWLPSEPRAANAQKDDWAWTLRSAANRPLLRWLEDGPLVVVSDGSGKTPRLKARLLATGQEGTFGESGERISTSLEETPADSRELLARVDFAPNTEAGMESMLGFRQDLGFAGSVQTVAAVSLHPEVESASGEGLDEAAVRAWESINLGDMLEAEAGSTQVLARFASGSPSTVLAALPFASVSRRQGDSTISYKFSTAAPASQDMDDSQAQAWLPAVSMRNGSLVLEHGVHQQIGWERRTQTSSMSVVVFADRLDNPALEAMSRNANGSAPAGSGWLFDPASGLLHVAGPNFSTAGLLAAVDTRLSGPVLGGDRLRLAYANGGALVLPPSPAVRQLAEILAAARPRRTQTYSISLSGTIDGTDTRWRASYRWQPEDTATPVAAFAENAAEPYLNLHLRQPIHLRRDGPASFEALLDLRNILDQGYRPYLLSDGSMLVFAQDQRGIRGGLAFNF